MMGMRLVAARFGRVLLFLFAAFAGVQAWAAIEEITVSTRKLEEDVQSVPIAIQAIGADEISRKGIVSLDGLLQQSSSLILDKGFSPQDQRIVIRGLSPTRGRQNVAVLQDGIDISSEAISTAGGSLLINPRLFDLERVEIVKGPQNALYGRSAFAGAINYITRKPGDEFRARVGMDVGNYGQQEFSADVSGPLSDSLALGFTGMVWNHDGYYDNALTGGDMGGSEGTSVAGTVVLTPTDNVSITARVEHLDDEFGTTPFAVMPFNATFAVPQSAIDAGITAATEVAGVNGDAVDGDQLTPMMSERPQSCLDPTDVTTCGDYEGTDRNNTRATLTIDWDLGNLAFTSLTHFADTRSVQREGQEDTSASNAPTAAELFYDNRTDLFSQEIRLASNTDGALTWVIGGLFWNEEVRFDDGAYTCLNYTDVFAGFPAGPQPCGPIMANIGGTVPLNPDRWERDTEHYSIYGLIEWGFLENWKIAFEGRNTWEDLDVGGPNTDNGIFDPSGNLCIFFGLAPCPELGPGTDALGNTTMADVRRATDDDDFFAPKLTLTWDATDNSIAYLSWARAYKPKGISLLLGGTGGFYDDTCGTAANPDCVDPVSGFRFGQEKLDAYEVGFKSDLADNRVRLNAAMFFQDFKNKQVSTQIADPNTGVLSPRIVNAGKAEVWGFELETMWVPTDNLSMSLAYTWLDTEYTEYRQFTTGSGTIGYVGNCTPTTVAGQLGCLVDYSGNELEDAPENALVGNLRWQSGLVGATDWFFEGGFTYQDDRFDSAQNTLVFPAYVLFDFRVGITNENLDLTLYVDNAFDDDTVKTGFGDGSIPTFFAAGAFLNQGTLYMPDKRSFGARLVYRFGATN